MTNVYWKGGTGATKSDPSVQTNWVDSTGTALDNTLWNSGNLAAHDIIFDITKNVAPTDPVALIFDGSPSSHTWNSLYIKQNSHAKWHNLIQFSATTTLILSGMDIRQSQVFSAAANCTIKFTGIPHFNSIRRAKASTTGSVGGGNDDADLYIKLVDTDTNLNDFMFRSSNYAGSGLSQNSYTTAGMFKDKTSRAFFTFLFEPPNNTILVLDNGIYPKMTFDCASTDTATLAFDDIYTSYNQYSNSSKVVDMLKLTIDTSFNVKPSDHSLRNKNKHIKLSNGYELDCAIFDMGYATLEIVPSTKQSSESGFIPSNDSNLFGPTPSATQAMGMVVKYHNLIIGSPTNENYKLVIPDNNIITCQTLRIRAGGRLYGPTYGDSNGAEVHCLTTPIIEGDWNFSEISTGIYRASGTSPTMPVSMGGTGLTGIGTQSQVLAVKSNGQGLEWRADIDTNTIYAPFAGSTTVAGLVPIRDSGNTTTKYLREDGDWQVPPSGGGSGAPTNASYVVIGTNPSLSNERTINAGTGISLTDNGANGNITIASTNPTDTFILVGEEADNYISSTAGAGNANGYCFAFGNGAHNSDKNSTGSDIGVILPAACTLSRVDITFGNIGNRADTNNQTLTVYKNGSSTTTTVVYNSNGSGNNPFKRHFASLSGNGLSYAAGDTFNLRATGLSGYIETQVGPARMTAYFTVV